MGLTGTQMGLCFNSYWYMWLTNGLTGLLFMGIDIGVAAFFMKKFRKNTPPKAERPLSRNDRPLTASDIKTIDESNSNGFLRSKTPRNTSAKTDLSSTMDEQDDFAFGTCEAINIMRQQYNAPPVELDDQLSEIAQQRANYMASTGKLEHTPLEIRNFGRQSLGENFTAIFQTELTANKMIRKWMKEGRKYRFGQDGSRETENFTQMVWKSTRDIGVGRAQSPDGNWWYAVVVFDPPGNLPNQYAQNVNFPI